MPLRLPDLKAPNLPELKALGKFEPLPASYYARETPKVAIDLLGKILIVRDAKTRALVGGRIVETEAYAGTDPASHSARGMTPRSAPMFEEPGRAYVYFTYGMYDMLNLVTEPAGKAGAVLIRGIEPLIGLEVISANRAGVPVKNWCNGPGRLCRALGINLKDNRQPLQGPRLFVGALSGEPVKPGLSGRRVLRSGRIGISRATDLEWRFFIDGNPFVSPVKENREARPLRGVRI